MGGQSPPASNFRFAPEFRPGVSATWGISDLHSWIPTTFPGTGAGLMFDVTYQPKPAYSAVLDALVNTPAQISAAGIVNAANYAGGAVSPGEIITLFGAQYGPAD